MTYHSSHLKSKRRYMKRHNLTTIHIHKPTRDRLKNIRDKLDIADYDGLLNFMCDKLACGFQESKEKYQKEVRGGER